MGGGRSAEWEVIFKSFEFASRLSGIQLVICGKKPGDVSLFRGTGASQIGIFKERSEIVHDVSL
jgi:hypothetical protein